MKTLFKKTEKRKFLITLLLLISQIGFYDYEVVYPCIYNIGSPALLTHTFFNFSALLSIFMIYQFGRDNKILRNVVMSFNISCSLFCLLFLLIFKFSDNDRLEIALLIILILTILVKVIIDFLQEFFQLLKQKSNFQRDYERSK